MNHSGKDRLYWRRVLISLSSPQILVMYSILCLHGSWIEGNLVWVSSVSLSGWLMFWDRQDSLLGHAPVSLWIRSQKAESTTL